MINIQVYMCICKRYRYENWKAGICIPLYSITSYFLIGYITFHFLYHWENIPPIYALTPYPPCIYTVSTYLSTEYPQSWKNKGRILFCQKTPHFPGFSADKRYT